MNIRLQKLPVAIAVVSCAFFSLTSAEDAFKVKTLTEIVGGTIEMLGALGLLRLVEAGGKIGGGFGDLFVDVLQLSAIAALLRFIELLEVFLQRFRLRQRFRQIQRRC